MMNRMLTVMMVLIAIVAGAAAPVAAHPKRVADPDDSPGPLDVKKVVHRHVHDDEERLRLVVRTHEKWRSLLLRGLN